MNSDGPIGKKVYERRQTYNKEDFESFGLKRTEDRIPFPNTEIFLYKNYQLWCKINHSTFPKSYYLKTIWDAQSKKTQDTLEVILEENK